jgi:hypothetical protein
MSTSIDIEAYCSNCGKRLRISHSQVSGDIEIDVEPCEDCLDVARDTAREEGRDEVRENK